MSEQELKERLRELHRQLADGATVDVETRELLLKVDADIQSLLLKQGASADTSSADLSSGLRDLSAAFASKHPHLEPVIRDLTEILGRMGI